MKKLLFSLLAWSSLLGAIWGAVQIVASEDIAAVAEVEATYARKLALLHRLENLPERESLIRRQLADLGNEEAGRFLYSGDHRSVQVMIQRDLRELAKQSDLSIGSMRSLNERRSNGRLSKSTVQLNLSTTQETLMAFFEELEKVQPMLRIDKMTVRQQRTSTESRPAILTVMIEVSGFRDSAEGAST